MTNKILYWASVACAGLALILSMVDMALVKGNQSLQDEIGQRQNIITIASNVAPLNQQLSQALYDAAQRDGNPKLRELLTSQGFVLPEEGPAAAPAKKESPKTQVKENEED